MLQNPALNPAPRKEGNVRIALTPEGSRTTKLVVTKGKDAFEGLGLTSPSQSAPTLREARKLRTGLAAVNAYDRPIASHSPPSAKPKLITASIKSSPSPHPSLPHVSRTTPATQTPSSSSATPSFPQTGELSAETRFPSLEEINAAMAYTQKPVRYTMQPESNPGNQNIIDLSLPSASLIPLRIQPQHPVANSTTLQSSTRSEQVVTGTPGREIEETLRPGVRLGTGEGVLPAKRSGGRPPRSSLSAKRTTILASKPPETQDLLDLTGNTAGAFLAPQRTCEYKDWLTGDPDGLTSPMKDRGTTDMKQPGTPVLREFTHKRSSFVEENNIHIQSPQEAITSQQSLCPHLDTSFPDQKKFTGFAI